MKTTRTGLSADEVQRLNEAISERFVKTRRTKLRKMFGDLYLDDPNYKQWTQDAINYCPLVGNGTDKVRIKTPGNLRDAFRWEVLLYILWTGDFKKVEDALAFPETHSTRTSQSVTGFVFGHHQDITSSLIANIIDDVHKTAEAKAGHNYSRTEKEEPTMEPTTKFEDEKLHDLCGALDMIVAHAIAKSGLVPDEAMKKSLAQFKERLPEDRYNAMDAFVSLRASQNEEPDYHDTKTIVGAASDRAKEIAKAIHSDGKAGGVTKTVTHNEVVTLNPSLRDAVNSLLTTATDGAVKDFDATLSQMNELRKQVNELTGEVEELRKVSIMVKAVAAPMKVKGDGTIPDGKVEMVPADEVFPSPNGKKTVFSELMIPRWEWDGEHPLVPTPDVNYEFRPDILLKFLSCLIFNKKTGLVGHTGTGKTTFIKECAARMGYPYARVNLDSNIERPDLVGSTILSEVNGATISEFVEGVLPSMMAQPVLFSFDEFDYGRPDVMYVVQRALEDEGLMLTEDKGRVVHNHPYFRWFVTGNTKGQGDEFGIYAGARVQSAAFLDRIQTWIEIPYLSKDQEVEVLKRCVPGLKAARANQFAQLAVELRNAFMNGEILMTISPRGLISLAELFMHFSNVLKSETDAARYASEMTLVDKATTDNQQRIRELVDRCVR